MKGMRTFVLLIIALSVWNVNADFYVATTGDDNAAGTASAPFKTLFKAKAAVRQLIPTATGPINVYVRAGTYYLDSALTFTTADGGTATVPVTYSAYRGEKVVLSGGIKVTSSWTTSSGNIKVTTIAKNLTADQLFLNGKRQVLARYPNFDSTKTLQGYAADCIGATHAASWNNVTEGPGYIRAIHQSLWGGDDYIITGKTGTTVNYTWVGDNNRGGLLNSTLRMVENIFEELDAPGEWFYRKATGQLYFYPPAGVDPNTATIELASLTELVRIVGTATTKVKYLTFNRLTFTQSSRTLFNGTFEGLLRGDWAIVRAGTVFIQDAENVTIKHCFFDQIGGNGIFMNAYNRNHFIYNNEFIDAGATCVQTVGLQSAVRSPSTWANQINPIADMTPGPLTSDYPQSIVIDNNLMQNLGVFEKQTAGVNISMSSKVTVRHNRITMSPRSAINVNDGTWGGHDIEYNDADKCVLETGDHGPFNSWGRDRYWGTNTTTTVTSALDAVDITRIHNNRFTSTNLDGYPAIDLDDGASYYWVYNNLCLQNGIKFREGFCRKGYNNIIVVGRQACHAWFSSCYDSVYHNIIVPSSLFTTNGNANAYDVQAMTLSATNKCYIDYNLFWNNGSGVDYSPTKNAGMDVHSQTADPKFVNAATGNYTVAAGSPALALGFVNFPMDSFGRLNVIPDTNLPALTGVVAVAAALKTPETRCAWIGNRLTVSYSLPYDAKVSVGLYSIDGKNIAVLENRLENAGRHTVSLDAGSGTHSLSSNTYLVKMTFGEKTVTRRIVMTK